jgi:NADH-quinone oxidoreductase subunit J
MELNFLVFLILSILVVVGGMAVVLFGNPIYSVLSLVVVMIGIAGLFVTLGAYFLAAVQVIVYAGAVVVVFLIVLMLFNLKRESAIFSPPFSVGTIIITMVALFCGLLVGAIIIAPELGFEMPLTLKPGAAAQELAGLLFTEYLFVFESIGVLLLVVAVGAVALTRLKGDDDAG